MAHGGKTPILPARQLQEIGYSLAIVPSAPPLAALAAMNRAYDMIKKGHLNCETEQELYDFHEFCNLIGFPKVRAFEQKWADQS
jgi:2-methylisocitrate lyase-like PEP mutase family enzyme